MEEDEGILCIDRESSGPNLQNNFMCCLGAAYIDIKERKTVSSYFTYLPQLPFTEWDADCVQNFWGTAENQLWYKEVQYNLHIYQQPYLLPNGGGLSPEYENYVFSLVHNIMVQFVGWVKTTCAGKKVLIMVDSDADMSWVNHYLPAPYSVETLLGKYQSALNCTSFYKGLLGDPFCKRDLVRKVTQKRFGLFSLPDFLGVRHDHHPTRDAEMTALTAAFFFWKLKEEKKEEERKKKQHENSSSNSAST